VQQGTGPQHGLLSGVCRPVSPQGPAGMQA
jgi:hypothetical protein